MSLRRKIDPRCTEDVGAIDNIEYNSHAGAKKTIEVGPGLVYVSNTLSEVAVAPGSQLFLFKTTGSVGYVTMSKTTGASVGTTPGADTFPVFGQVYTPISSSDYKFVIGTADIHLYILKDDNTARVNP